MVGKMRANHKHYTPPEDTGPDLFSPPTFAGVKMSVAINSTYPPAQPVDTSLAAAAKVSGHTARIREGIFLFIRAQGARGATAGEVEDALALSGSTVRPRLRELQGSAPWAKGKLLARIIRTAQKRQGMRVYQVLA